MKYESPPLLFVTHTPDGIVAHVVLQGEHTTLPLTKSHAFTLLGQLAGALEWSHAHENNPHR